MELKSRNPIKTPARGIIDSDQEKCAHKKGGLELMVCFHTTFDDSWCTLYTTYSSNPRTIIFRRLNTPV